MLMQRNICHQAIFFRKSVFKRIGNFNLKYPINADWEHNLKWFNSKKITKKYVELVVCHFGNLGISSTVKDQKFKTDKDKLILKYCWRNMSIKEIFNQIKIISYKYI